MRFSETWREVVARAQILQADQTLNMPWFVPALIGAGAFALTFARVEIALPLLILATALDRYRFDFGGAGLRIEHFVFAGVAAAWLLRKFLPRGRASDGGAGDQTGGAHKGGDQRGGDQRGGDQRGGDHKGGDQTGGDHKGGDHKGGDHKGAPLQIARADLLLVAYLAVALVSSVLYAPVLRESLKFFGLMVFGAALYWLVQAISSDGREFARGVWALVIAGVAASLFGILAWAAFPLGLNLGVQIYALGNFQTHSPYGTLFDSNTLGMYAMAATCIQVTLLLDAHFAKWRVWLGLGTLITLIAVALSLTRVAWIGLVVGLFLVFLCSPRQKWALAIGGAAVALVVLALVANSMLAGGGGALAEFSVARVLTSRSIFFRLDAYTRAWSDFLASPLLGNGVNVFAQKYTAPSGSRDWISNFFLMALNDTGLVGLGILLAWLGWLGYETRRALQRAQGGMRAMLLGLSIAYLALLVTYQATTVFWLGFNWVYLGMLRGGGREMNNGQ